VLGGIATLQTIASVQAGCPSQGPSSESYSPGLARLNGPDQAILPEPLTAGGLYCGDGEVTVA
jgi:hypothetical protein